MSEQFLQTSQMARFAISRTYEELPIQTIDQLKKHLLDSVGSLIHCVKRPTIQKLANQIRSLSGDGICMVPSVGRTAPDRAAQFYTALIRYPDFMDNFLGKEATCHPSDNIGSLLAAAQMINADGKKFLTAMAISYEMQCRLVEEIPVMIKGFDHTLLLAYSITAGLCKILQLSGEQTAHALSIAGCTINPLVTCRAAYTREWKGLQSSMVALVCMNIVLLAKEGVTGPLEFFEGPKGFEKEFGMKMEYHWEDDHFNLISKCILKRFNSEVHTQSLLEAALELKKKYHLDPDNIEKIDLVTFLTTYHIVGGGEYGDRKTVHSKEQADHSLPYVIAAILLDDELYPDQLLEKRINKKDVQKLLQKVQVHTKLPLHEPKQLAGILDPYTKAYPGKMMGEVKIKMKDGKEYALEKQDYYGFHTRPMSWTDVKIKFRRLTEELIDEEEREQLISIIESFDRHRVKELTDILQRIGKEKELTS
jgi:2-methylcitrate dehydratase